MKRFKRTCLTLVLVGILALALICLGLWLLARQVNALALPALDAPLDVVLILDHSNSMWELGGLGSDPNLLRVDAARLFISYLGVDTTPIAHRVAVIHFGTLAELVVPLTLLDSPVQREQVSQVIAEPQRMGWTDPLAALNLAYQELYEGPRADPSRRPAIVLLSDGKPERSLHPSPEQTATYLADLRAQVDRFHARGCPVFTIALTSAATDADPDIQTVYHNLWQEIAARTPPAEYHQARTPQDLLYIYHDVVARLSGATLEPPVIDAEIAGPVVHRVQIEEPLARLTLVLLKADPSIQARVLRPEGLALRVDDPDVRYARGTTKSQQEVWTITHPRTGDWTVELEGQGQVIVWKDSVPLAPPMPDPGCRFELLEPGAYVPDDRPLVVTALVRGPDGETLSGPDLQVTLALRRAGYTEATLLARDDGTACDARSADGVYSAQHPQPALGAYTLHLRALRDGRELASWEHAFEIVPLPRLELLDGPDAALQPAQAHPLRVRVLAGPMALDAQALAPLGTLTATLSMPDGDLVALALDTAGEDYRIASPVPQQPGDYWVTLYLSGRTAEGLPFADQARVPFRIEALPTATPQPTPTHEHTPVLTPTQATSQTVAYDAQPGRWPWALAAGGMVLVTLAGGGYGIARQRRPRLEGQLRVLESPAGQPAGAVLDLSTYRGTLRLTARHLGLSKVARKTWAPLQLRATRDREGDVEVVLVAPAIKSSRSTERSVKVNDRPLHVSHTLCDGDVLDVAVLDGADHTGSGGWRLCYENLGQAAQGRSRRSLPPVPF